MSKHFTDLKSKTLPNSEVEIIGVITLEFIQECRKEALKELNNKANFPGFRPGKIPEETLIKRLGEMAILEESAEIALGREYGLIIKESGVKAIGRPSIGVTKLALGVPLEFKIITAVEPEFDLPDYKALALAAKKNNPPSTEEITDKEIEEVKAEIGARGLNVEIKDGEDLNEKIKENLKQEKEFRAVEKVRIELIDSLIKETKVEVPKVLVDSELEKMLGSFKDDVSRAGMKWEDYLKSIKKSEAEIKLDWAEKALNRAKAELIVGKIALVEKIEPSIEELEHEAKHLLEHYPEADPLRVRVYLYAQMRNQKVFEFLDKLV